MSLRSLLKAATLLKPETTDTSAAGAYAPLPATGRNPLTGWFHAEGYGVKVDGTTDDTAAWQAAINAAAAAGGGTIYCGKRGTSLISGAQVTGTAQSTAYSGQLLLPAVAGTASRVTIEFRGPVPHPGPLDAAQAEAVTVSGLVLLSNATSGNIMDVIPGYTVSGPSVFSNVAPFFRNITFRAPNNPQCGGLYLFCAATAGSVGLAVDINAPSSGTGSATVPTGSKAAITLPGPNNMATGTHVDPYVAGFPVAMAISEHAVIVAPKIFQCGVGIRHNARFLHKALVQHAVMAQVLIPIQAVNSGSGGGVIEGDFDLENDASPWGVTAFIDDPGSRLEGTIHVYVPGNRTAGLLVNGCENLRIRNPYYAQRVSDLPCDTFTRVVDAANKLGASDISSHPWLSLTGNLQTSSGKAQRGTGTNAQSICQYWLPSFASRTLTAKITTGTAADVGVVAKYVYSGASAGNYLTARMIGTAIYIQRYNAGGGTYSTLASAAGVIAASTSYTLVTTLTWTLAGAVFTAYLNGVQAVTYTALSADITALTEGTTTTPGKAGDGLLVNNGDVGSYFTLFQVQAGV